MAKQLIKDLDYEDGADALKPASNAYNLTAGLVGSDDLPIYAKALYLPAALTLSIVPAADKRAAPVAVTFTDHPAGYFQMQVRRITAIDNPAGVLVLHDNRTKDGDVVPGEA